MTVAWPRAPCKPMLWAPNATDQPVEVGSGSPDSARTTPNWVEEAGARLNETFHDPIDPELDR